MKPIRNKEEYYLYGADLPLYSTIWSALTVAPRSPERPADDNLLQVAGAVRDFYRDDVEDYFGEAD